MNKNKKMWVEVAEEHYRINKCGKNEEKNNMKKLREGWHIVAGYSVYVDSDGMIRHGTKKDNNGSPVPAYPYYWSHKYNCWTNAPCTPSQLYHENWSMK